MPYDRFLIAPLNTGLQKDLKPWMIPDDAFETLQNSYVFRGRVRKRFGSKLLGNNGIISSVVRINLGNTDASGNFSSTVPGSDFFVGQYFTIGNNFFTSVSNGTPANMIRTDGLSSTATYNTVTGDVVIQGSIPATAVYFYPSTPIMGFAVYQVGPINNNPTLSFDTQFSYQRSGNFWQRAGTMVWTGSDSQFFWSENYRAPLASNTILFTTNFNAPDGINYWNGMAWTSFQPAYSSTDPTLIIKTCRIIISFKSRLVLLNTIETISGGAQVSYVNRARWPLIGDATATNAYYDDPNLGFGGFDDAPTKEAIISAQILKDRLIVFFEQSTWEYVFTNNQVQPFRWQKINDELGCESTFSVVPFDKALLAVGNVGIHACNGSNVERIDEKIPDTVFSVKNLNEGVLRVFGIRDFETELVYWTFPSMNEDDNHPYPNRVLIYNYRNGSWSFNIDSFTAFGYIQLQEALTWEEATFTWQDTDDNWVSGIQQQQNLDIIAGNQQGFTFIISPDLNRNAPSLYIYNMGYNSTTRILTLFCLNNNLEMTSGDTSITDYTVPGDCVLLENIVGMINVNGRIYSVTGVTQNTIQLSIIDDPDNTMPISGTYLGGGTVARVSNLYIKSKQWNPYAKGAKNIFITKIDFNVDKTTNGQVTVDYFPSFTAVSTLQNAELNNCLQGNGVLETSPYTLYPLESYQTQLWHPIYLQTDGETIQILIYMNLGQMAQLPVAMSDFQLHAILLYATPIGRLQ